LTRITWLNHAFSALGMLQLYMCNAEGDGVAATDRADAEVSGLKVGDGRAGPGEALPLPASRSPGVVKHAAI
jgi:hypothetical protein